MVSYSVLSNDHPPIYSWLCRTTYGRLPPPCICYVPGKIDSERREKVRTNDKQAQTVHIRV
jgi:hypothetical protein